jgi:hypothetical protein
MIVSLTIRCDWPGCRERLTYAFATLRPQAPGWNTEMDSAYLLHRCPNHNRYRRARHGFAMAVYSS